MDAMKRLLSIFTTAKPQMLKPISHPHVSKTPKREVDYTPRPQSLYQYRDASWQPADKKTSASSLGSTFRLITWNIDCQAQGGALRMAAALQYLEQLTNEAPPTVPVVVFLQEMTPVDLKLIQDAVWVQGRFHLTDMDTSNWQGGWYGTTTLIDRRLPVKSVYRVYYKTDLQRDGLFVDLIMKPCVNEDEQKIVRLCNTHLESLVADSPLRPAQMETVAKYLHAPEIHGGLVAGDFNAIQDFDRTLHTDNELKDVYLELGGSEDNEEGYTWGQQAHAGVRERFGCSRMDKIFYCGGMRVEGLQRIGIGIKVEESKREKMRRFGAMEYVTDHYGLMADVTTA